MTAVAAATVPKITVLIGGSFGRFRLLIERYYDHWKVGDRIEHEPDTTMGTLIVNLRTGLIKRSPT